MRKPLIFENRHDTNDLKDYYNPDKYQHTLGMYVQTNDVQVDPKQALVEKKHMIGEDPKDDDDDTDELCNNPNDPDYDPTLCDDSSDSSDSEDDDDKAGTNNTTGTSLTEGVATQKNQATSKP
jgi:hypothetical protein